MKNIKHNTFTIIAQSSHEYIDLMRMDAYEEVFIGTKKECNMWIENNL